MGVLIALILAGAGNASPSWATSSVTFMQATVVSSDAAGRTLGFVDVSGRNRSLRVTGEGVPRLGRLRPGDEVIVVLSGAEPVVQDVRVSQAAAAVPADVVTPSPEAEAAQWTVVPAQQMRPSWPNPYSRFHRGAKPARPPQRR